MTKLLENQDSRGQWIWVLFIRLIGVIMIIAPLYLPFRAYFLETTANVSLVTQDVILIGAGIVLSSGGKQIGTLVNNLGIAFKALIQKFEK